MTPQEKKEEDWRAFSPPRGLMVIIYGTDIALVLVLARVIFEAIRGY